jgi:hypothetical protein
VSGQGSFCHGFMITQWLCLIDSEGIAMQRQRRSPSATQTQLLRRPHESERVLQALVTMATRIGRPFTETRMQQLCDDLNNYPVDAIEWALDAWGRNAKVLPALADLIQLLRTWHQEKAYDGKCSPECEASHGKGLDWNDILWMHQQRCKSLDREWTDAQWQELLLKRYAVREGGAPELR